MTEDLRDELEIACMDAMRGDPPGPAMAGRLTRAVTEVLMRRGVKARVEAKSDRSGTSVTILLQKPDRTVQRVVLTI